MTRGNGTTSATPSSTSASRNPRTALTGTPSVPVTVAVEWGRQLAEVCLFPRYTRENVSRVVVYDGFENFERAYARGKGVLFLTAHLGAWELSAFAHSLQGHPLSIVMRSLDNPYIDARSNGLVYCFNRMKGQAIAAHVTLTKGERSKLA